MDQYHDTGHRLRIHDKRQRAQDSDSVDAAVRLILMKTDTPRTDKIREAYRSHVEPGAPMGIWHHAEELERENARLRDEINRIANDYIPDNDSQAPLALQEMRDALNDILSNTAMTCREPQANG